MKVSDAPSPDEASFTVALLMGGQSKRMGHNKAYLRLGDAEGLSWERQAALLEQLEPQAQLLSLRPHQPRPELDASWETVFDDVLDAGPLAGITACLDATTTPWLLVLAVDLLAMQVEPLRQLLHHAQEHQRGAIFQSPRCYETLAAVYPKAALPSAQRALKDGDYRLQAWVRHLIEAGVLDAVPTAGRERTFLKNINTREAYADYLRRPIP